MRLKQKGFTLIELLIVIAIIGLLASIILVNLNKSRIEARDAKRHQDIDQLYKAMELYYSFNGQYPNGSGSTNINNSWANSADASWDALATQLAPYLSPLPTDPLNETGGWAGTGGTNSKKNYSYLDTCVQQAFVLVYELEDMSGYSATSSWGTACYQSGTPLSYSAILKGNAAK